jgi:hypothetical protein
MVGIHAQELGAILNGSVKVHCLDFEGIADDLMQHPFGTSASAGGGMVQCSVLNGHVRFPFQSRLRQFGVLTLAGAAKTCVTTGAGLWMKAVLQIKTVKQAVSDWISVPGLGYRSDQEFSACFARSDTVQAMRWLAAAGAGRQGLP